MYWPLSCGRSCPAYPPDYGRGQLDTVELVMALEEGFGAEIPGDAAETIQT